MKAIEFDEEAKPSFKSDGYIMWANAENKRIRCYITELVFTDCLNKDDATSSDFPEMFKVHRALFEDKFRKLIRAKVFSKPQDDWNGLQVTLSTSNFSE